MKKLNKILFVGFICLFCLTNVNAKQNKQTDIINISINMVQNKNVFETMVTKKLDTNADNILCTGKFGFFLKQVSQLIKFAVPIIIIALAIVDFVKAMAAQKQEEIKNAATKLIKRMIIGAIIFLLPTIIDMLLDIAGITSSTCGW